MISDLIEFGKWLDENNQDDFGKLLKDEDKVIPINVQFEDGKLKFDNFEEIITDSINNYDSIGTYRDYKQSNSKGFSLFANQLFFETNQNVMIPSNNAFACLTPFVVSLRRVKEKKVKDSRKRNKGDTENKGKKKKEKLEFTKFLSGINNYKKELLHYYKEYDKLDKINANLAIFQNLFENAETLERIINEYYDFLYGNFDKIKKLRDNHISKNKGPDIYLYFKLPDEYVLFNDAVYLYCKYLKPRAEEIDEREINFNNTNKCHFCDSNNISFVRFSPINIEIRNYNWNLFPDLQNSRLRICKSCSMNLYLAIQKLIHVFENHFLLVPKLKTNDKNSFKMITTELNSYYNSIPEKERSKFVLLNNFMSESEYDVYFNFDFLIFQKTRMGDDIDTIKKYVENYKSYLIKFKDKDISLYDNNTLVFLYGEKLKAKKRELIKIKSIFDVEFIIKSFFLNIKENRVILPNFNHFYEIYTRNLTGKKGQKGIMDDFDSKTISIFAKYMHNMFNLIYELNEDSINKNMLNEIVLNSLVKLQRYNKIDNKNPKGSFYFDILRRLNYYFMLKQELLGDSMLQKENIAEIKGIAKKYNAEYKVDKITLEDSNRIAELVERDTALKYYLIGQFLGLIDNSKGRDGKKKEVFANFVTNINRNNIRNLFVTEVLQKNNYYIAKMNKKGKFIFKLFENDIDSLFNESDGFSFEDYIILIFTGYYTENVLSSSYGTKKKEDDKDE